MARLLAHSFTDEGTEFTCISDYECDAARSLCRDVDHAGACTKMRRCASNNDVHA